jgi:hypothetical protein
MIETGTVIHGTLRDEDLIPAFLEALRVAGEPTFVPATNWLFLSRGYFRYGNDWVLAVERTGEDEVREQMSNLTEYLFDSLDAIAPPGTYFGTHPGDGSDFGFWAVEDDDDGPPLRTFVSAAGVDCVRCGSQITDGFALEDDHYCLACVAE